MFPSNYIRRLLKEYSCPVATMPLSDIHYLSTEILSSGMSFFICLPLKDQDFFKGGVIDWLMSKEIENYDKRQNKNVHIAHNTYM